MQLTRLARRIQLAGEPLWVTFDSPQSRSLLAKDDVEFVRFTAPRDPLNVLRNLDHARRILDTCSVSQVISTGSGIALSFLPLARAKGIECHYIESAARSMGPSMTGRAMRLLPGVNVYTQYPAWADSHWTWVGSVIDEFQPGPARKPGPRLQVVVSLGTLPYRFDRMVEAILRAARPDWDFTWQVGPNAYGTLPGLTVDMMSAKEFAQRCELADVVLSHSGVGTALNALESGKHPVLFARSAKRREHVDEHQRFVADELASRKLATLCDPEKLTAEIILRAASKSVEPASAVQPISLGAPAGG